MDNIDTICANSFRNFHAKDFDYLCLKRSPALTLKAYFFGPDCTGNPEVVMPHDHRYDFNTRVLSGSVVNHTYEPSDDGDLFDGFEYLTPLNGGAGFAWKAETRLRKMYTATFFRGEEHFMALNWIHTIAIEKPNTVLLLRQFDDQIPIGTPTLAFRPVGSREPPSLDGLYDRMTPDHAISLIERLSRLGMVLDLSA